MAKAYEYHPIAAMFPMMDLTSSERKEMLEDIRVNGQQEDIDLHDGQILDGRHRYEMCMELGIKPKFRKLPKGTDPVAYVISKNLHRRHLNAGQRAMLVLDKWDEYKKDAKNRQGTRTDQHPGTGAQMLRATEDAAKDAGVSDRTMHDAVVVKEQGSKKLQAEVRSGKTSVKAAAKQVREVAKLPLTRDQMLKKIPKELHSAISGIGTATIERLSELTPGHQREAVGLLTSGQAKTLGGAIGAVAGGNGPTPDAKKNKAMLAQQTIKTWMDAVGRWMPLIDGYRETYSGAKGDKVIETAKSFFNAMTEWRKAIK